MFEPLILILLSMLVGGAVVQQGGMKSLSLLIAGILVCLVLYGGILGLIIGVLGIMAIIVSWFVSGWKKPVSPLYITKSQKSNEDNRRLSDSKLSEEYRQSFQAGLKRKYPEKFRGDHQEPEKVKLIDRLRNNLQAGFADKYPAK